MSGRMQYHTNQLKQLGQLKSQSAEIVLWNVHCILPTNSARMLTKYWMFVRNWGWQCSWRGPMHQGLFRCSVWRGWVVSHWLLTPVCYHTITADNKATWDNVLEIEELRRSAKGDGEVWYLPTVIIRAVFVVSPLPTNKHRNYGMLLLFLWTLLRRRTKWY